MFSQWPLTKGLGDRIHAEIEEVEKRIRIYEERMRASRSDRPRARLAAE